MTPDQIPIRSGGNGKRIVGLGLLLLVLTFATMALGARTESVDAATVSFSQCNGRGPGPGGAPISVNCSVTIVNSITPTGNSSQVTFTRQCALNACTGDSINVTDVVNNVQQCNGSDNVGGSTTVCSVNIINNIVVNAVASPSAVTVNQCVGSGAGGGTDMTACIPSTQGSPTVTQCNGSGNGGGGKMTCSASGSTSTVFPIAVNQCNGSENGGGSFVTCTASITTNITVIQVPGATPTPIVIPGAPTATLVPGAPTAVPGAPTATPVPGAPIPPVFFPPQQPPFFPPQQPPFFFPPAPPLVVVPPRFPPFVVTPPTPTPFVPVAPPVTVPPVAPPQVTVPPVAPPLPPQSQVVFPPEEGFRPPSSGDGGLLGLLGSENSESPVRGLGVAMGQVLETIE